MTTTEQRKDITERLRWWVENRPRFNFRLTNDLEEAADEIDILRQGVDEADDEIESLRCELQSVREERDAARAEVQCLRAELKETA